METEYILTIAFGLIRVILSGRATIGIAALLGGIPPKSRLYWIKPLLILWLLMVVGLVVSLVALRQLPITLEVVGVLSDIILLFLFMWLAYKGSKDEVKEKMKAAGSSYSKTNWGLIGIHFFVFGLSPFLSFPPFLLLTFYLSAFFDSLS